MTIISAPAGLSGVPLAELKQWLAITTDGEDDLLVDLLAASHALCQRFTGIAPFKSEVRETVASTQESTMLRVQPVLLFLEATAVSHTLDRRPLVAGEAVFERVGHSGGRVTLHGAIPEPQVELRYYCGFSDEWGQLDVGLRHGIIRYAAHQYRERDAGADASPPAAVAALWRPYRRMRL